MVLSSEILSRVALLEYYVAGFQLKSVVVKVCVVIEGGEAGEDGEEGGGERRGERREGSRPLQGHKFYQRLRSFPAASH